jgi:MFS family permease
VHQRFTGLWRHPDFLKLWAAQSVSLLGTQVTSLALPLTAVLVLHASPSQMGALAALGTLPFLLVGLFAGAWVDRTRRRPILIGADISRAVLLATIPLAAALDRLTIEQLYLIALLVGFFTVFFDVAYQSYLPALVTRSELIDGNSKLEISNSSARVAGPGVGGIVVQILSAPAAILLDSISFLASALFLALIRRREPSPEPRSKDRSIWREIGEGLGAVFRHPLLRPIVISTAISNLCMGVVSALFVLFLTRTLGLEPSIIGLILVVGSIGAVGAAFTAGPIARRYGLGPSIIGGKLFISLSAVLLVLATGPTILIVTLLVLSRILGGATAVSNINQLSLRQIVTPARLHGRVNATNRFVTWATAPFGALLGGLLAEQIGIRAALALAATGITLAAVWLLFSPLPSLKHPTPDAEPQTMPV